MRQMGNEARGRKFGKKGRRVGDGGLEINVLNKKKGKTDKKRTEGRGNERG